MRASPADFVTGLTPGVARMANLINLVTGTLLGENRAHIGRGVRARRTRRRLHGARRRAGLVHRRPPHRDGWGFGRALGERAPLQPRLPRGPRALGAGGPAQTDDPAPARPDPVLRSEEHTSELQSRPHLVCRLLLENKKKTESLRCSVCCSVAGVTCAQELAYRLEG